MNSFVFKILVLINAFAFSYSAIASETQLSDYELSPLANYLNEKQFNELRGQSSESDLENQSNVAEGKIITIDTRDQDTCLSFVKESNADKSICEIDKEKPFVSLVVIKKIDHDEFYSRINSNLSDKQKVLLNDVRNFGIMGAGMIGLIYALPESISRWDHAKMKSNLFDKYKYNVTHGPVIDHDNWAINYIAHPIVGAAYYTIVRHQGFSRSQSFAFSFCMSTFYWEYGLEAFAELPSIQDLIITPLIGSVMGEIFYQASLKIEDNGGEVLGSKKLGSFVTVLLNPAEYVSNKINNALNFHFIKDSHFDVLVRKGSPTSNPIPFSDNLTKDSSFVGLKYEFDF